MVEIKNGYVKFNVQEGTGCKLVMVKGDYTWSDYSDYHGWISGDLLVKDGVVVIEGWVYNEVYVDRWWEIYWIKNGDIIAEVEIGYDWDEEDNAMHWTWQAEKGKISGYGVIHPGGMDSPYITEMEDEYGPYLWIMWLGMEWIVRPD